MCIRDSLHFTEEDIAYLRGRNLFCEEFLDYLKNFRFTGDVYAIPEGTPVFPKEPLVIVRAPAIEAQLIETFTLLTINHQSLIATKANRICLLYTSMFSASVEFAVNATWSARGQPNSAAAASRAS